MKKYFLSIAILALAVTLVVLRVQVANTDDTSLAQTQDTPSEQPTTPARESITFILNEDKNGHNGYYTAAANYYRVHPEERTDYVITHLRTLVEVRDWLEQDKPMNGQPWGRVNLVVHANEWIGLASPIVPGGMRATRSRLETAAASGQFVPLADSILDAETELVIHGCGLGRNMEMLSALAHAFGGKDAQRPVTSSSRFFLHYAGDFAGGRMQNPERYLVKPHYTFYKTGNRPSNARLASTLAEKYPKTGIDWKQALQKEAPRFAGDAYHESFKVPILWTVAYPDKASRPDISTDSLKQAWMDEQEDLQKQIEEIGIPESEFDWTVQRVIHTFPDGSRRPAIRAVGLCTVLTVLQAVTAPDPDAPNGVSPLIVSEDDPEYYSKVSPGMLADCGTL